MIHELGVELAARLGTQGVPLPVVDGPEPTTTTTWGRERIVIQHADGGDAFGPPRSQHINPKHRHTRTANYKLTIYAKSAAIGAAVFEHRRRAEHVLDKVLCAMDYVAAVRKNRWAPKSGGFITPPDLAASEKPGGAVYELSFTFDRAVIDRTWANAAAEEFTITADHLTSTTKVSQAQGPDDDSDPNNVPAAAETACGA
jgi:hypothetical protein